MPRAEKRRKRCLADHVLGASSRRCPCVIRRPIRFPRFAFVGGKCLLEMRTAAPNLPAISHDDRATVIRVARIELTDTVRAEMADLRRHQEAGFLRSKVE